MYFIWSVLIQKWSITHASYHCLSTKNERNIPKSTLTRGRGGRWLLTMLLGSRIVVGPVWSDMTTHELWRCMYTRLKITIVKSTIMMTSSCTPAIVWATPQHSECNAWSDTFGIIHKTVVKQISTATPSQFTYSFLVIMTYRSSSSPSISMPWSLMSLLCTPCWFKNLGREGGREG